MLSIGSVGSFASIGSVGSSMSLLSLGSSMSVGSVLSSRSTGSLLSSRSRASIASADSARTRGGEHADGDLPALLAPALAGASLALVVTAYALARRH